MGRVPGQQGGSGGGGGSIPGSGGDTGAPGSVCFKWLPGSGESGPVAWDSLADLFANIATLDPEGCYEIDVDGTDFGAGNLVVPAGTYDFEFWFTSASISPFTQVGWPVVVGDGVFFSKYRGSRGTIDMTVVTAAGLSNIKPSADYILQVLQGGSLSQTGIVPFVDMTVNAPAGVVCTISLTDSFTGGGQPLVLAGAGQFVGTLAIGRSAIGTNTFSGELGFFTVNAASGPVFDQPNLTLAPLLIVVSAYKSAMPATFAPIIPGSVNVGLGSLQKVDPSAAQVTVNLDPDVSFIYSQGQQAAVVNVTDSVTPIIVQVTGGGTINGQATFIMDKPRQHCAFRSNGNNDYLVVSDDEPGGSWGDDYQVVVEVVRTQTMTTNPAFANKISLVTPALTGTYRVAWFATIDIAAVSQSVRVRLNNATDATVVGTEKRHDMVSINDRLAQSGVGDILFAGAAKTFDLEFNTSIGLAQAGCEDARIELWRVGP